MNRYPLRQIISILLLPGTVTLLVPAILLRQTRQLHTGWELASPWSILPVLAGLFFLVGGLVLIFQTISLFARVGKGTLAPWDPTRKLVLRGPYRYVRNPMISGVLAVLLAEAILCGSTALLIYFAFASVVNMIYLPLSEEPGLLKRFGAEYAAYKGHVPRWIPRLKPWDGEN
jgi:protein-S-isoprenylcysteine O-methyltransferase Ste14